MYYHADHLGGTNVLTDNAGTVKELCEYLPFGGFSRHDKYGSAQEVANFYFTGKEFDEKIGLYYYGARYYNPLIGRFLTPDTIVQSPGGNPQTLNRYTYCNNNPVNLVDPTGHKWSWKKFWNKWGDFISPLCRAIVTGDWANLGFQCLNILAIAGGVMTGNPLAVTAGILSYTSRATDNIGDNVSREISRGLGYASLAVSAVSLGLDFTKSAQDWSKVSKINNQAGNKIEEISKLEKTA
jgi:RHS repeat-associated protein